MVTKLIKPKRCTKGGCVLNAGHQGVHRAQDGSQCT